MVNSKIDFSLKSAVCHLYRNFRALISFHFLNCTNRITIDVPEKPCTNIQCIPNLELKIDNFIHFTANKIVTVLILLNSVEAI